MNSAGRGGRWLFFDQDREVNALRLEAFLLLPGRGIRKDETNNTITIPPVVRDMKGMESVVAAGDERDMRFREDAFYETGLGVSKIDDDLVVGDVGEGRSRR